MSKNSIGFNKNNYRILETDIDQFHNESKNRNIIDISQILLEISTDIQYNLQITAERLDVHLFDLTFTGLDICDFLSYYNQSFKKLLK